MRIAKCGLRNLGWRFRDSHAVRSKGKAGKADCEMRTAEFSEDGSGILTLLDLRENTEFDFLIFPFRKFRNPQSAFRNPQFPPQFPDAFPFATLQISVQSSSAIFSAPR